MSDTDQLHDRLQSAGLVPVITIEHAGDAVDLGAALLRGGLAVAEVTFRTAAAAEAIRLMHEAHPDMLIGAGTVLDPEWVDRAVDAGAAFVVAPGFNPRVVDHCIARGVPVIPGVNSPTQIEQGRERGLSLLKFFPAEASGGLPLLKAMAAPYSGIRYMPTGGVTLNNLSAYLGTPLVVACGGTWLAPADAITAHRFDEIARTTSVAVAAVIAVRSAQSPNPSTSTASANDPAATAAAL